jgi:hypothetical protein
VQGGKPSYSYKWFEGDNVTPFSTSSVNFCHLFSYPGPYDIKLEVTDAVGSKVAIIQEGICLSLPIELTSFTATEQNRTVQLAWSTATEQNNAYFDIERAGGDYTFKSIGNVPGAGNSTQTRQYAYTDKTPLTGLNYYRLKQVDTDGAYTYSPVVPVRVGASGKLQLHPVPASDRLNVTLAEAAETPVTWHVFDVSGRLVLSGSEDDATSFAIELGSVPDGAYTLQVLSGREILAERFIKN